MVQFKRCLKEYRLFVQQLKALVQKHFIEMIRRPFHSLMLILFPALFILLGFIPGVVETKVREWFPRAFPIFLIGTFIRIFGKIVAEKESRIKDGMKIMGLKDEYIASKQRYDEKTRQLVARIEMLKHRYRSLEKRRAMELSEFGREIKLLRGQLNTVERTVRFIRTAPPAQTNSAQKSAHADLRNIKNHLENMLRDLKSEV
eukprot:178593_1